MGDILARLDELVPDELIDEPKTMKVSASRPTGTSKPQSIRTSTTANQRDDELQSMLSEFDLLAQVQADTGEQGSGSGSTIKFHRCPICHHADDFVLYTDTRTWSCFSASNTTGISGGTALDYLQATGRAHDANSAVKLLREQTGHPYQRKPKTKPDRGEALSWDDDGEAAEGGKTDDEGAEADPLPMWEPCRSHDPRKEPPELIGGLLRRGAIGVIAAKGKATKTWLTLRLAIEVTQGGDFLGHALERGRVLFVDAEMGAAAIDNRVRLICTTLGYDYGDVDAHLTVWSVEGYLVRDRSGEHAPTVDDLLRSLRLRGESFDLVIIDSCANFLQSGADENSNSDVTTFFGKLRRVTSLTGAAVWLSHHFGKGAQGDRDGADMLRGASAWLDRPSVAFVMREVFPASGEPTDFLGEGKRAFDVECVGMRSFAWPEQRHVIWSYPTHRLDVSDLTRDWKPKSNQRDKGKASAEVRKAQAEAQAAEAQAAILAHIYHDGITDPEGLSTTEAAKVAAEALGKKSVETKTLRAWLDGSPWLCIWKKSQRKHFVCPTHLAPRTDGETPEGTADIDLFDLETQD